VTWLFFNPLGIAALWWVAGGVAVYLYLLHRPPRIHLVSTLRLWMRVQPEQRLRRYGIREPWALLAQLLFLLLVIAALANPHWGTLLSNGRNVVVVMDGSIWSRARPAGGVPWINGVREQAARIVASLPANDRILLLRADGDALPVVPFTKDRARLNRAIASLQPSSEVADLPRALEIGTAALAGSNRALLVYIGPGMIDEQQEPLLDRFRESLEPPDGTGNRPQFVVRLVGGNEPVEHAGITRLAVRRDDTQPDRWHLLAEVKNYGPMATTVSLGVTIDGQPLAQETLAVAPGETSTTRNDFAWTRGGLLEARLSPSDKLETDEHAIAYLPAFEPTRVAVFSPSVAFANEMRAIFSTNPFVSVEIVKQGEKPSAPFDLGIYSGSTTPAQLDANSVWFITGPSGPSAHAAVRLADWNAQHPVTRWVRTRDVSVRNPGTISSQPGDTVLASVEAPPRAPLIVAREQNGYRAVIVGFDPRESNLPMQPAFPLLIAGAVEWITHPVEDVSDSFSTGEIDLPGPAARVLSPSGRVISFARNGSEVHFLAAETGLFHVLSPEGERSVAVNAPELPSLRMRPNSMETARIAPESSSKAGADLWIWLIPIAMVLAWAEWFLYYYKPPSRALFSSEEGLSLGSGGLGNIGLDARTERPRAKVGVE